MNYFISLIVVIFIIFISYNFIKTKKITESISKTLSEISNNTPLNLSYPSTT